VSDLLDVVAADAEFDQLAIGVLAKLGRSPPMLPPTAVPLDEAMPSHLAIANLLAKLAFEPRSRPPIAIRVISLSVRCEALAALS
jgi:hypothetical protein